MLTPFGAGKVILQADWFWKGAHNLFPSGGTPALTNRPGYGLLNGQIAVDLEKAGLKVSLWGKNLTDKRYIQSMVDLTPALGVVSGVYSWPRTYGVTATKRF